MAKPLTIRGITYKSRAEAARAHGLERTTFNERIRTGLTPEQALGLEPMPNRYNNQGKTITYEGKVYRSHKALIEATGAKVLEATFNSRIRSGWTVGQALGFKHPPRLYDGKAITVNSITFPSLADALEHHGFDRRNPNVAWRLRNGWSTEEAFEIVERETPSVRKIERLKKEKETGLRKCNKCQKELPLGDFAKSKNMPLGRTIRCKECRSRERHKNYGLTDQQYDDLFEAQGGKCAICGTLKGKRKTRAKLCVDHCHKTGNARGLLCNECNSGIGRFNDDSELLESAAKYLRAPPFAKIA